MIDHALSEYVASVPDQDLPPTVVAAAKSHIADTLAAGVSGSLLEAGRKGWQYARHSASAGDGEASGPAAIWGSSSQAVPAVAALANAMASHADETDDSHTASGTHPGCSVVPAVIAAAESVRASGRDVLSAVVAGYDICARMPLALWPDVRSLGSRNPRSSHAAGGLFGAVAALCALYRFSPREVRYAFELASQMLGGTRSYFRDRSHVEKAFVYAGMPTHGALLVTSLVRAGWAAADDPFDGSPSVFDLVPAPDPTALIDGLGRRFEIEHTRFKKYPVASPAQSPVEVMASLMRRSGLRSDGIAAVEVRICPTRLVTVGDRPMPNVNIGYLLDCVLADGDLSFEAAHDWKRFDAWRGAPTPSRVVIRGDDRLRDSNGATVVVRSRDGDSYEDSILFPPGDPRNPISAGDLRQKWLGLLAPVLGHAPAMALVSAVDRLETVEEIHELTTLLRTAAERDRAAEPDAAESGGATWA